VARTRGRGKAERAGTRDTSVATVAFKGHERRRRRTKTGGPFPLLKGGNVGSALSVGLPLALVSSPTGRFLTVVRFVGHWRY